MVLPIKVSRNITLRYGVSSIIMNGILVVLEQIKVGKFRKGEVVIDCLLLENYLEGNQKTKYTKKKIHYVKYL